MSNIDNNNTNHSLNKSQETASEHQKELLDHYADALEDKQEDSLKGTHKENKKKKPKTPKRNKDKSHKNRLFDDDDEEFLYTIDEDHISDDSGHEEGLEEEFDEFAALRVSTGTIRHRSKSSTRKRTRASIDDDDDDESETDEKSKRKKRGRSRGASSLDEEDMDNGIEVDIGFSGGSDDDQHDEDDQNQIKKAEVQKAHQGKYNGDIGHKLDNNKTKYMKFLRNFSAQQPITQVENLSKTQMQNLKMAQNIVHQMFQQFIEGMQIHSKETPEHQTFGRGARLAQEILRAFKNNNISYAQELIKKMTMKSK